MTGPEAKLQRRIRKAIRLEYGRGAKFFKIHGNEYQEIGTPDLLGCVQGLFFGFEVKVPGEKLDPIQRVRLLEIRAAGGVGEMVTSERSALRFIARALLRRKDA